MSANEPENLIINSPLHLPTVGMVSAAEEFVLEIFRYRFFDEPCKKGGAKSLELDNITWNEREYLVIGALRGRPRKDNGKPYYTPAYPALCKDAWFRTQRPKIVDQLLFKGILAHSLAQKRSSDEELQSFVEQLINVLVGRTKSGENRTPDDVYARLLEGNTYGDRSHDDVIAGCTELIRNADLFGMLDIKDPFSDHVTTGLRELIELEQSIPRHQWIQLLSAFLRTAIPIYFLGRMRFTCLYQEHLIRAIKSGETVDNEQIKKDWQNRHDNLLIVGGPRNRWQKDEINRYWRARIELNLIVAECRDVDSNFCSRFEGKKHPRLVFKDHPSSGEVSLAELSEIVKTNREHLFKADSTADSISGLRIKAQEYAGYRDSTTKGIGKNIFEFLKVLHADGFTDDRGSHSIRRYEEGRRGHKWACEPGPLLLQLFVFFAQNKHKSEQESGNRGSYGHLTLHELIEYIETWGFCMGNNSDGQNYLKGGLTKLGLISGSPDAGNSVPLSMVYGGML